MPFETYVDGTGAGRQRLSYYADMDVYIYRGCVGRARNGVQPHANNADEACRVANNAQAAHHVSTRGPITA